MAVVSVAPDRAALAVGAAGWRQEDLLTMVTGSGPGRPGRALPAGPLLGRQLGHHPLQGAPDPRRAPRVGALHRDLLGDQEPHHDPRRQPGDDGQPGGAGLPRRLPGARSSDAAPSARPRRRSSAPSSAASPTSSAPCGAPPTSSSPSSERALTFLATTASATPFIGLFGTVWGIMNAFRGLSATQSSSIQAVAPGIAEALIATADRPGRRHSGRRGLQPLRAADSRALGGDGQLRLRIPQHRRASLPEVEDSHGLQHASATTRRCRRSTSRRWSTSCWCCW